jgi:Competence protein CoiA-like family
MKIAGAADGVVRASRAGAFGPTQEIRCPSCSRLLVLRCGPAVAPHFAHRPRQSCRNRPGATAVAPHRFVQLTLFELDPGPPPAPIPAGRPVRRRGRRRRKAWLPRLIRWLKGVRGPASLGLHP